MEQTKVRQYAYQLEIVLGVLNSPEALISDETTVGDMIKTGEVDIDNARLVELADIFGIKVSLQTPVWELGSAICWEEAELADAEHDS